MNNLSESEAWLVHDLTKPIEIDDVKHEKIFMREPTTEDLSHTGMPYTVGIAGGDEDIKMKVKIVLKLISRTSGIPYPYLQKNLHPVDLNELGNEIIGFFMSS